jgi:hypothetical protein
MMDCGYVAIALSMARVRFAAASRKIQSGNDHWPASSRCLAGFQMYKSSHQSPSRYMHEFLFVGSRHG